jgi:CheY-like chemotaxis protein
MTARTTILIADDNEDEIVLIRDAFAKSGWQNPVSDVRNGLEAKDYLEGVGPYADRNLYPYPSCLLLDLHMPEMSGTELLLWIRSHRKHRRLLVFVLTMEKSPAATTLVYDLAANCFLEKPADFEGMTRLVQSVISYLEIIQMPPPPDPLWA